jgi:signal transduction histidine kinase
VSAAAAVRPGSAAAPWIAASALLIVAASAVVIPATTGWGTTHSGSSALAFAADLAAGAALVVGGSLLLFERVTGRFGLVAIFTGLAWLAADWVGWAGGPPLVRSSAEVVAPFLLPLLLHLTLAAPRGLGQRSIPLVVLAYSLVALTIVASAVVRDPTLDPYCWRNCTQNVFLVASQPGIAGGLQVAWLVLSLAGGLAIAVAAVSRLSLGPAVARRSLAVILLPAAALGIGIAGHATAVFLHHPESPYDPAFALLFHLRAWSAAALGLGIVWQFVRARRVRLAVHRLASDLGRAPPPGSIEQALISATGDQTLTVAYWLERSRRFVDAQGRPLDRPATAHGRASVSIVRGGRLVAVVEHDAHLVDPDRLRVQVGAAARLAVENERLQAEIRAQLHELQESRKRIVASGESARRRLERDLHDGAQQRLLALSYELRLARSSAEQVGEMELVAEVDRAVVVAHQALDELRELAHGIYPTILEESGLAAALATLAEKSRLPVEIGESPAGRLPAFAEVTAYIFIDEAVREATSRGATHATVRIHRHDARLEVEVVDDGRHEPQQLVHLDDRVGAAGGSMTTRRGPGIGTTLTATIPCA